MSSANLKAAATGQATPQEARNPYEAFKRSLEASRGEFLPLLGTEGNVATFIRVVLNAVLANPDLLVADRRSLIAACMKAAQDGQMPDGRDAVLNVYNTKVKGEGGREEWVKKVQYLPMVGGMVKAMYESGEVTYVDAACVFENDRFVYRRGEDPKIEHEPTLANQPGQIIAAYAVVKLKNGEVKREVMPKRDLDAVRAVSKAGDASAGPWTKWPDQMSIKSVLKRIQKQLPRADAFERLADRDNAALGYTDAPVASVADITARVRQAAPPPPALEDHSGDAVLDFGVPQDEREPVTQTAAPPPPPAPPAQKEAAAPKPPRRSYAAFVAILNAHGPDGDAKAVAADMEAARAELPPEHWDELCNYHERVFGSRPQGAK